jgi:3'(2'), 5'-bisphosphate nucleotidase
MMGGARTCVDWRLDKEYFAVTSALSLPASLSDLPALAETLGKTARKAGAAIMEIYHSDFAVDTKDDKSPVTAADAAGEKIILADLLALTPDLPVVAEESAAAGVIPDISGGIFWLVDPLDGTKEFIKRNGEFTVNIGLIVHGRPLLGVVYAPVLDILYLGWGPGTCLREKEGLRQAIQCRVPGADGVVVLASRSHATSEALQEYLKGTTVASITNAGSSLKFCRLAEGDADLYPRFGPTCEWDTAAAHAVLLAAGGDVVQTDGAPFEYGKAPTFLNPSFIAKGAA